MGFIRTHLIIVGLLKALANWRHSAGWRFVGTTMRKNFLLGKCHSGSGNPCGYLDSRKGCPYAYPIFMK